MPVHEAEKTAKRLLRIAKALEDAHVLRALAEDIPRMIARIEELESALQIIRDDSATIVDADIPARLDAIHRRAVRVLNGL